MTSATPDPESPPPPRRKGCGCWTLSLATLAGAALFVLGIYAVWRWSNARGVERMIAIAREKGEPTTWEELSASYPTSPEIERTTSLWVDAMKATHPSTLTAEDFYDVPIVGGGNPEGAYERERAISPRMLEASRNYVAKTSAAIERAHEARRSGTQARFPLPHEAEDAELDERLGRLRQVANAVALDLEVRRLEEPRPPLGEHHLTLLAISQSLREEPYLRTQFSRLALLDVAQFHLLRSVEAEELTDEELLALQPAWGQVDLVPAFRTALEELQLRALFEMDEFVQFAPGLRPCPEEDAYLAATMLRAFLDAAENFSSIIATFQEVVPPARNAFESPLGFLRFGGSERLLPLVDEIGDQLLEAQTQVDALETILACERFRRAHGDWPETISQLVPDWLEEVPIDAFSEKPMLYRQIDDGIIVYAVDYDGNDDGGAVAPKDRPSDVGAKAELGKNLLRVVDEKSEPGMDLNP